MLKTKILILTLISGLSLISYYFLGSYNAVITDQETVKASPFSHLSPQQIKDKRINEIQDRLRQDKQNGNLWFMLGSAYMFNKEYGNAVITYNYAIRLTKTPTANHYSAKASALFYKNGQQFNPEIESLLAKAIKKNPDNNTANTMLATQADKNQDYKTAIKLWVQLLDSEQKEIDRVTIIKRINEAKRLDKL